MAKSLIRKNQLHPDIIDLVSGYGTGFFVTPDQLNNSIDVSQQIITQGAVLVSGDQNISGLKNFVERPTINGTGVLLQGETIDGSIENVVYTTGAQTIGGIKNFENRPTYNSTGLLIASDLSSLAITISGLVEVSGDIVYATGDQKVSGVKNFVNTTQIDSIDFLRNFIKTGENYNFISSGIFNFGGSTGSLYTGWNLASTNPSDDYRSIKLSNGSYIVIHIDQIPGGSNSIGWFAVTDTGNLSNLIPFNLYSGNVPFKSAITASNNTYYYSGFLPREYNRLIIKRLGGGGLLPSVGVSGDLGVNNEIRLESRNNRLFLGNSGILFQGETIDVSTSQGIINTTYSELTGLKAVNGLNPGQYYRISDFQLMWWNQSVNDNTVKMGLSAEPLIVLALSGNKISQEAKSELYPQDTIYYDIDATSSNSWGTINNNTAIPNFKGWIYRRIDHKLNIDIPWDWRHITVNCCRPDMSSISLYNAGTTYSLYSVVKNASNKLYYSKQDNNTGNSLTNIDWWLPVSTFTEGDTYFVTDESYGFRADNKNGAFVNLPADTSTRIQQPTFTSSLVSQGTFQLTSCNNIKIEGGYSNVFLGSYIDSNTIGTYFYDNTIGSTFFYNTIGNSFYKNTIGTYFNSNTIGNYFYNNTIGNTFSDNTIENSFYDNTIGSNFYANTIGPDFNSNTIGDNFSDNTIGNSFYANTIGNSFYANTIGNYFNHNTIGNSFYFNTIGNFFNSNTIGNIFRGNTVENTIFMGDVTGATHIYNNYNTRIFTNSNNIVRLSYFNSSDQLVVTDPTA